MSTLRLLFGATAVLVRRPDLWVTALRQFRVLVSPRWWRRAPFLPVPDAEYVRFRLQTAYGGDGTVRPTAGDLVAYLEWCRSMRTLST